MLTVRSLNYAASVAALSFGSLAIPIQRVGRHTDLFVNFCTRVLDDVSQFVGSEVPVHRDTQEPTMCRCQQNLEVLTTVTRKHGNGVASLNAIGSQLMQQPVGVLTQDLPVGGATFIDQGYTAWIHGRVFCAKVRHIELRESRILRCVMGSEV